jgi:hypothetical protein
MPQKYTFVTVSHAVDYGLLKLQARSMGLYCPPSLVHEILIVENFDPGASMNWRPAILAEYGPLAGLVRFVVGNDIAPMPASSPGWWKQQALKISVSNVVTSERYVVLDAKNQLVQPLTAGFLETASGQPRLNGYSFVDHPLKDALIRTLGYLAVDPTPHIQKFTRTSTPFTMLTARSKEIVAYVEAREGKAFGQAFLDNKLTEFFLFSGFLQLQGALQTTYDMTQPHCAQIWGFSGTEAGCQDVITRASNPAGCPFIAVHRVALKEMDVLPRVMVCEFWCDRGLFATVEDSVRFSLTPNA